MEGCGDGMWNGVRYFSCRQGYGFFCPLVCLRPDERVAQPAVVDTNRKYPRYIASTCIYVTRNELASLAHSFYTCLKHQLMHQ